MKKKSNELQQAIDERCTDDVGMAIITMCDIVIRLRLGQIQTVVEELTRYMKPNFKNLHNIRKELHELVDLMCTEEWTDKKYHMVSPKLRDLTWKIQGICNGRPLGQCVDLEEPLYKGIELGEYIRCKAKFGKCDDALKCWITRKGFCSRYRG